MPFIRLCDNYIDHPKFLALSADAFRLWHEGMSYCRKHQTDGAIPAVAIRGFRYFAQPALEELLQPYEAGANALWARTDRGFQVHDFLEWNPSREDELQQKRESAERTARWRRRKSHASGDASRDASPDASRDARVPDRTGSIGSSEGVQGEPAPMYDRRATPRRNGTVFDGALQRDHLAHVECSENFAWCVPSAVHAKLVGLLAPKHRGDRGAADKELRGWYRRVWARMRPDTVMGDAFRFWQAHFDADFVKRPDDRPDARRVVAGVDETQALLQTLRGGVQ